MIALMSGVHQVIAKLLYGSGLRITECIRLRVQDVDLEMKTLTVRNGKGAIKTVSRRSPRSSYSP